MNYKLILVAVILLSGCASHKSEYGAQCLPYTGCPLNLETPEQFAARKLIEEECAKKDGCGNEVDDSAEMQARKEKWAQENREAAARKEKQDKLYKECSYEADKAMASRARPYNTFDIIYNTIMDEASKTSLIASCMRARG